MFIRLGRDSIINLDNVIRIERSRKGDTVTIHYINTSVILENTIVENNKDLYDTIFEILMNHKMV